MATLCAGLLANNPKQGKDCNEGFLKGLLFSDVKTVPIALTSLDKVDAINDLQLEDLATGRFWAWKLGKEVTAPTTEVTYWEGSDGEPTETNRMRKAGEYDIVSSACSEAAILPAFATTKTMYAYLIMSTGLVKGKNVGGAAEPIKVRISATKMPGNESTPAMIRIKLWVSDVDGKTIGVMPEDYVLDDLLETNVGDIQFVEVDKSLTTLTVGAFDSCNNEITSLSVAAGVENFILKVAGTAVALTGATKTGNTYVLTFALQTEGAAYALTTKTPKVSTELVEVRDENALTGTLNA